MIGPWVGFNLSRFHDTTFVSTNDGIALAGSNCDTVYSGAGIGLTSITGPDACIDNPPPPGDQSQVEAVYRKRALHYMRTHSGGCRSSSRRASAAPGASTARSTWWRSTRARAARRG